MYWLRLTVLCTICCIHIFAYLIDLGRAFVSSLDCLIHTYQSLEAVISEIIGIPLTIDTLYGMLIAIYSDVHTINLCKLVNVQLIMLVE